MKKNKFWLYLQPWRSKRRKVFAAALQRKSAGVASVSTPGFHFDPKRFCLAGGTACLLSLLLCIHLWPNRVSLRLGEIADRDIIAQRTVRYEDTAATALARVDAGQRIKKRYDAIDTAATTAQDTVKTVFQLIEKAATPQPVPGHSPVPQIPAAPRPDIASQINSRIHKATDVTLPQETVAALLHTDDATRQHAGAIASALVDQHMMHTIKDDTRDIRTEQAAIIHDPALRSLGSPALRDAAAKIAGAVLIPNQRYNERQTEQERQAEQVRVLPQMRRLSSGSIVIREGDRVEQQHLDAFAALGLQEAQLSPSMVVVITVMVTALLTLVTMYLRLFHPAIYSHTPSLLLLAILTVISVVGLKIGSTLLGLPFSGVHFGYLGMMCVASAGMAIALLISPSVATLVVAILSVASGLIVNNELRFTMITLGSSLVGIIAVATLRNRGDLVRAMLLLCSANAVLNVMVGQLEGDTPTELLSGMLWGVISGLFALALFWIGVAVFEKWFGITTHLRLLELSDPATPVLQEFRMRVPGTYAHSLMVGNLAHAAAEAVGANALLVRVAAYYHDLGKMNRPEFFIENQCNADNVHDRISPSLSALVLSSHVKDSIAMAEEIGLPPRVREVIQQHHGTTLMKYFYHRATGGVDDSVLESQFRYAGPKPQTKEAAILMLADGVEAASRTLERPTPSSIADFVARMIEDKRADNQLDECDLTLRDLKQIQETFVRTLSGTLHARIQYPMTLAPGSRKPILSVANGDTKSRRKNRRDDTAAVPVVPLTLSVFPEAALDDTVPYPDNSTANGGDNDGDHSADHARSRAAALGAKVRRVGTKITRYRR